MFNEGFEEGGHARFRAFAFCKDFFVYECGGVESCGHIGDAAEGCNANAACVCHNGFWNGTHPNRICAEDAIGFDFSWGFVRGTWRKDIDALADVFVAVLKENLGELGVVDVRHVWEACTP